MINGRISGCALGGDAHAVMSWPLGAFRLPTTDYRLCRGTTLYNRQMAEFARRSPIVIRGTTGTTVATTSAPMCGARPSC